MIELLLAFALSAESKLTEAESLSVAKLLVGLGKATNEMKDLEIKVHLEAQQRILVSPEKKRLDETQRALIDALASLRAKYKIPESCAFSTDDMQFTCDKKEEVRGPVSGK